MAVRTLPQTILFRTNHVLSDSFRESLCNCSKRDGCGRWVWSMVVVEYGIVASATKTSANSQTFTTAATTAATTTIQCQYSVRISIRGLCSNDKAWDSTGTMALATTTTPTSSMFGPSILPQLVALSGFTLFAFVLLNRDDENMYEYWRQVEQGHVPMDEVDIEDDEENDKRGA
jgi:hypothetical protein